MKAELIRRVEKIESKITPGIGVSAILSRYVVPGHIDKPVDGWSFGPWDKRVQVLREAGESDEDLRRRAIAKAREHFPGSVLSLTSIG